MKKYLGKILVSTLLSLSIVTSSLYTTLAYVLYETGQSEVLAKNTTYEKVTQATENGLLDIHILRAPIGDEYIKIKPIQSSEQYSLKQTTSKILQDNGAIAGVNADFFKMSGTHSAVTGTEVKDGEIITTDIINNMYKNEYATFFIDDYNNPFIDYLNVEIDFLNNGVKNIQVFAINKITDMAYSVYVDRNYITNTKLVDSMFNNLTKIVVEDGIITYISEKGENVEVPENGFVILISEQSAEYQTSVVNVGETAEIQVRANFDINSLSTAIGGAGKILQNSQIINDGSFVPSGKQPRTAIGFSADRKQLILMVVDGRSHSIGVTHNELGDLMLKFGASDAMHLDGGGSSTMGVKSLGESSIKVVNTLSEGSQRKVANALGIFNEAPVGPLSSIQIKPQSTKVFKNTGLPINILGSDDYLNVLEVPNTYDIGTTDINSRFENGYFYPSTTGNIQFSVIPPIGETKTITLKSLELGELIPENKNIVTGVGQRTNLGFNGRSKDGFSAYVYTGVNYEVVPSNLGHMEGDVFIADSLGSGYIKCQVNDISTYIDVNVGHQEVLITSFENDTPIKSMGYPDTVLNATSISTDYVHHLGYSARLDYVFSESDQAQAAYLLFENPIQLPSNPIALKFFVYGDDSNNRLRGRIKDADGNDFTLDFLNSIDFTGWRQVSSNIPADVKYPITLERLYVVSDSNYDVTARTLYFDNVTADISVNFGVVEHPTPTTFSDPFNISLSENNIIGYDVTFSGNVNYPAEKTSEYNETLNNVINKLNINSEKIFFAGKSDLSEDLVVNAYKWNTSYAFHTYNNLAVAQMSANKGGILSTNAYQWSSLVSDVQNSGKDHIIIELDISPKNFKTSQERELFQKTLEEIYESGKNVFVISTEGYENSSTVENGIRYINLGGLFKEDKSVNSKYNILRFRVNGNNIHYEFQN